MRRSHFEALAPFCPACRAARGEEVPLALAEILREEEEHLVEGSLSCQSCAAEYPILDGVPLLLPDLRAYVASGGASLLARDDLAAATEARLGEALGPGSAFDVARQHLSIYAWDHFGDLDPDEAPVPGGPVPGGGVRLLERGLAMAGDLPPGPVLDLGCAVGRTTFALAERTAGPVLGLDLSFPMLRVATAVLRRGRVRYPRRRVGLIYDRREFTANLAGAGRVDFWAADAVSPPLLAGQFAAVLALNLLDCTPAPCELLATIARLLAPRGKAILATPYDWSPHATPVEAWIGGHWRGDQHAGASEPALRALFTPGTQAARIPGLGIIAEQDSIPWRVRLHDRSTAEYGVHLFVAEMVDSRAP